MPNTYYSSIPNRKFSRKKQISQLALDSFEAVEPFINVFDCGISSGNSPFHLITKEEWQLYARHKAGERNLTYEGGHKFNPYLDVVRNIYSADHVHRHIEEKQISYYTSGKKGLGLLYLDIDAHHPWQTDEYEAKRVLQTLFPFGYFRASTRGQNGFLKVRYASIEQFNALADNLQAVLQKYFLSLGLLCDIEIKGTITNGKSGKLAKLPFTTNIPCRKRDDTDSWNYHQLKLFKASEIVNANRIQFIASELEPLIDDQKVQQFAAYKNSLSDQEKEERNVQETKKTTVVKPIPVIASKPAPFPMNKPIVRSVKRGISDGDAFLRNQKDLLPFVRNYYKKHKSYPDVEEALDYLHDNGLFSGNWDEREDKRAIRVEQILSYTQQTFDPQKLSSGQQQPIDLRLGKYSWWVRDKFGSGMSVPSGVIDFYSMTASTVKVFIPARVIETFLIVADACLKQDPLWNQAVPTNRFKKLWEMVVDGSPWNQKYYQIVRELLNRLGVIKITDRKHRAGKAWRWEAGAEFPAESYKRQRLPSLCEAGIDNKNNNKVHNTLYHISSDSEGNSDFNPIIRPPPWLARLVF